MTMKQQQKYSLGYKGKDISIIAFLSSETTWCAALLCNTAAILGNIAIFAWWFFLVLSWIFIFALLLQVKCGIFQVMLCHGGGGVCVCFIGSTLFFYRTLFCQMKPAVMNGLGWGRHRFRIKEPWGPWAQGICF